MKLKDLPVGAKVSDRKRYFPWLVAEQASPDYEGTVLLSDYLAEAGCFDAPEPESRFDAVRQFGWNRWPVSNVHWWLNSPETDWFTPAHPLDRPPAELEPYDRKPGFLTGFSDVFLAALQTVPVVYAFQDDYYQLRHGTEKCRVFLPSLTELGQERRENIHEGTRFAIAEFRMFLDCAPTAALAGAHSLCDRDFHPTSSYPYWTRSVDLGCMSAVYFSGMSRQPYFHACQVSCGIRPAVVLDRETELEETPDRYGVYRLKGETI